MDRQIKLRMTGQQHATLYSHLYPGDKKEAVSIALCGIGEHKEENTFQQVVCIYKIINISNKDCYERTKDRVHWNTNMLLDALNEAAYKNLLLLKIHSHPTGYSEFSSYDDDSDKELFKSVAGRLDTEYPGISAIMLPNGHIFARTVRHDGEFNDVSVVSVVGPDIQLWYPENILKEDVPEHAERTIQTFGKGTTKTLSKLTIGIIGTSGTGSPVIEMLYRLGVGKLIIVDDDIVKDINVGRIYNSTLDDANHKRLKVDVLAEAIIRSGLPTKVIPIPMNTFNPNVVRQLSQCDILFGCTDAVEGRDLLNRLATFYTIPFFDLGVKLEGDGNGGVTQVCGTVNYLQPGGSSLFSRGVYTSEDLKASSLRRTDPDEYKNQVQSKYIKGVQEDRPAVIRVNTLIACLAVNDFLARIHQFRDDSNSEFGSLGISLTQTRLIIDDDGRPCEILAKQVGRGNIVPLLNMPALSGF